MPRKMISKDEWRRVKETYRFLSDDQYESLPVEFHAHGSWKHVYCEGCDSKYGTIMVSSSMMAWRHPTMEEFYGGAVID